MKNKKKNCSISLNKSKWFTCSNIQIQIQIVFIFPRKSYRRIILYDSQSIPANKAKLIITVKEMYVSKMGLKFSPADANDSVQFVPCHNSRHWQNPKINWIKKI